MPAATFMRETMIKARVRGPSLFDVYDLVDKITSNIDNKKHSIGIFLYLSKAFDTIDHQILL